MPLITRPINGAVDLLQLQRLNALRYPMLLQSVAGGNSLSRWDILFIANGEGLQLHAGHTSDLSNNPIHLPFLNALDVEFAEQKSTEQSHLPFIGGWAVYLGYELAGQIEHRLHLPEFTGPLPDALALRCPAAVLYDKQQNEYLAIAESNFEYLLDSLFEDVQKCQIPQKFEKWPEQSICIEDEPEKFIQAVQRILEYLKAGDVFQVNVSRAWQCTLKNANSYAHDLYQRLCRLNPAPFAGVLQFKDWSLISSSPERLVSVNEGRVQTRPIAGTRPRIAGENEQDKIDELIGHPKERAEHVMLIDLERNDLSRVCKPGSIVVDELMIIESYEHVHHIVSNVSGQLLPGSTPGQIIAAVFPGGTITGCPKVRCMEIIAELEQTGRGPYTGAMGYLNRNGNMDLNILIRSLWLSEDIMQLRAGAGIVFDSVPEQELQETRDKARGVLRALGVVS
jgi:anthranilate synthase component 1